MNKVHKRKNKKIDKILPRSGLHLVSSIIPDKGPNSWGSFNSMMSDASDIGACFEDIMRESIMTDDDRSRIILYINWHNPYTNKDEEEGIYMPYNIIDKALKVWLKDYFNIDAESKTFRNLLSEISVDEDNLEYSKSFMDILETIYLSSDTYKEDVKELIRDYEFFNDYEENTYEEDDEYVD